MSKEFKLTSTGYKHNAFMKDTAKLDKFLAMQGNFKPLSDGKIEAQKDVNQNQKQNKETTEETIQKPVKIETKKQLTPKIEVTDAVLSETSIMLDEPVSECFADTVNEDKKEQKEKLKRLQETIELEDLSEDSEKAENKQTKSQLEKKACNQQTEQQERAFGDHSDDDDSPIRDISDEFHRIYSYALRQKLMDKDLSKLKDTEGKIILDSTSLVELISLITGTERRKVVIHYKDPIPEDVGCFCTFETPEDNAVKDIKDIKINNQDMKYAFNAHFNALTDEFGISLTHMIHYNETQ